MGFGKIQVAVIFYLSTIVCLYCQDQYELNVELKNVTYRTKPTGNRKTIYVVPVYTDDNSKYGIIPACIDNCYKNKHCNPGECVPSANCTQCYINSTGCFNVSSRFLGREQLRHLNSPMAFRYSSLKKYLYLVVRHVELTKTGMNTVTLESKADPEEVISINVNQTYPEHHVLNTSTDIRIDIETTIRRVNEMKSPNPTAMATKPITYNYTKMAPKSTPVGSNMAPKSTPVGSKTTPRSAIFVDTATSPTANYDRSYTTPRRATFVNKATSPTANYDRNYAHKHHCYFGYFGLMMVLILINMLPDIR